MKKKKKKKLMGDTKIPQNKTPICEHRSSRFISIMINTKDQEQYKLASCKRADVTR